MSDNKVFDELISDLEMPENVTCEACESEPAIIRVSYACGSQSNLMCVGCFNLYLSYMLKQMFFGSVTGRALAHICGTPLRTFEDITAHMAPEPIDGSDWISKLMP